VTGFFVRVYRRALEVKGPLGGDCSCQVPVTVEIEALSVEELQDFFWEKSKPEIINWAVRLAKWIGDLGSAMEATSAEFRSISGTIPESRGGGQTDGAEDQGTGKPESQGSGETS